MGIMDGVSVSDARWMASTPASGDGGGNKGRVIVDHLRNLFVKTAWRADWHGVGFSYNIGIKTRASSCKGPDASNGVANERKEVEAGPCKFRFHQLSVIRGFQGPE